MLLVFQPQTLTLILEYSNLFFTGLFAFEMLLKLVAEGPFGYISDGFNLFDGAIVVLRYAIPVQLTSCNLRILTLGCILYCWWCVISALRSSLQHGRVGAGQWRRFVRSAHIPTAADSETGSLHACLTLSASRHAQDYGQCYSILWTARPLYFHLQVGPGLDSLV